MKILLVCNNAFNKGNGITTAIDNTMRGLRERGHDVRLMAATEKNQDGLQPEFPLEHFVFPLFEPIVRKNGFAYAKIDRRKIREAVRWADVIHLEEALFLEYAVVKIARQEGKPCVSTFHLYPHNILANLGFGKKCFFAPLIMRLWNRLVYDRCTDVQCPTEVVRDYLRDSGTRARLHVVNNGINIPAKPPVGTEVVPGDVIDILMIGRLSNEKSPETLLDAMRFCNNAGRIRMRFAGKGPKEAQYRRMAEKLVRDGVLRHEPVFGFYSHDELADIERTSYLYVHCAWVEVDGLACLEATREGLVPVIGEGALIGTSRYALCPESLYPERDARELARRIDWWIAHPEARNRMSVEYAAAARKYALAYSLEGLEKMYSAALHA